MPIKAIIVLAFACSVAAFSSCIKDTNSDLSADSVKSPILTVTGESCPVFEDDLFKTSAREVFNACDLRRNPEQFNGKFVRVRSQYAFMVHGSYLTDPTACTEVSNSVHEAVSV